MNIEEASEVAREFARKNGYPTTRLEDVELVEGKWTIILNYKLFSEEITLKIVIDDESGEIVEFKKLKSD